MARKKRRSSKKKFWKNTKSFLGNFFCLGLKVIPLVLIMVMGSALFMGVRSALYADSNLAIQSVVVHPPHALSVDTVQTLEKRYLGQNILKIDLKKIARNLEKDPHIRTASIKREFPVNLKIEIDKRSPIGLIQFKNGGRYGLVSSDGMILDVLKNRGSSFLVFEVYGSSLTQPRTGVQVRSAGFDEAVRFVRAYWESAYATQEEITRLRIDKIGNVTITLGKGPSVRLGRKPSEKFYAMEKVIPLLSQGDRHKIDYIDLQYDDVIVRRKK